MHEESMGRFPKGWWFKYTSKHPGLKDVKLSKVIVTRATPDDDGRRQVKMQLYDDEGHMLMEPVIASGDSVDLDANIRIEYN